MIMSSGLDVQQIHLLSISYIYAFCSKQGMMRKDLYISTPHTNI